MDERVEGDILRRVQSVCDDAMRLRKQYINLSKRNSENSD
jgi:hypothetical protein